MKLDRYISPEYLETQKALHKSPKGYGGGGDKWADGVWDIAHDYDCNSILDYGCGQGTLALALMKRQAAKLISEYDPAIKGKHWLAKGARFDLVVCTDVLEHIEPDRLGVVIDHLFYLAKKALFLVIATRPSNKFLSDGRNAHLHVEPDSWWLERIKHPAFEFADPPKSPLDKPSRELVVLLVRQ